MQKEEMQAVEDMVFEDAWEQLVCIPFRKDDHGKLRISKSWKIFKEGDTADVILRFFDENYTKGVVNLMLEKDLKITA